LARIILGVIFALAFVVFFTLIFIRAPLPEVQVTITQSFSSALWNFRSLDVFLQLLILLSGTFAILTLIKRETLP